MTSPPTIEELKRLPPDGGPDFNRLVFEISPYLLQHASNPVDWRPWGDEAFNLARTLNKPVFLSIGYSTCHWCHVMERESFEDAEVAALLNRTFVNVKVDREERPDVDNAYMDVCQAMTGGGGWPLTIVMTSDREPFFAGTYLPKSGGFGRPGLIDLIQQIDKLWREQRDDVLESAGRIIDQIRRSSNDASNSAPPEDVLRIGYEQLAAQFDARSGGFGHAPKFPTPHHLSFLLRYWKRTNESQALQMVEKTLHALRDGGIYDHLGFGFHRYSTDGRWFAPHFEKMLYDQAGLAVAYIEAFQATSKQEYSATSREILEYVLRDMTAPAGGFFSAEDADSDGIEGKFYVWTNEEIESLLGALDARIFQHVFNLRPTGNFTAPHAPPGANITHRTQPLANSARDLALSENELQHRLETIRRKLLAARLHRTRPFKDDKILADWNGLMITAMARAGQTLDEPRYVTAAQNAADFLLKYLLDEQGRLLKRRRQNESGLPAHLDDYAFVVQGLLDLYEACFEVGYLEQAINLNQRMLAEFWDSRIGGLFFTSHHGDPLPLRTKTAYDGAMPSGNSIAMLNLLRLSRMTAEADLYLRAEKIASAFAQSIAVAPVAHTQMLSALDFYFGPSREIVISADNPSDEKAREMLGVVRRVFAPNKIVLFRPNGEDRPQIVHLAPFTALQKAQKGEAAAYVCSNHACQTPITAADDLLDLLAST